MHPPLGASIVFGVSAVLLLAAAAASRPRPKAFAGIIRWAAASGRWFSAGVVEAHRARTRFRAFDRALADFRRNAPVLRGTKADHTVRTPRE